MKYIISGTAYAQKTILNGIAGWSGVLLYFQNFTSHHFSNWVDIAVKAAGVLITLATVRNLVIDGNSKKVDMERKKMENEQLKKDIENNSNYSS